MLSNLDISSKLFIDKTTVIYGESNTGKSTIIVDILYTLSEQIDQIIVFAPTDRQTNTYGTGLVPLPCIHYVISSETLSAIYDRQEALVTTYSKANNPVIIDSLFNKIRGIDNVKRIIDEIRSKFDNLRVVEQSQVSKLDELSAECTRVITNIRKKYITDNRAALSLLDLTTEEAYCLRYLNLNPKLILIFDDCTVEIKTMAKKSSIFQKFFYQGRHLQTTIIIACHSDICLPPDIKKNVFISMYSSEKCATATFDRASANMSKVNKKSALDACTEVFMVKWYVLVCIRDSLMYKYKASLHNGFKFGSKYIWEFCKMIENDGQPVTNNRFIGLFN